MTNTWGKLTEEQREYVVHRLAAYDPPSAVQRGLLEEFGVDVTRSSIQLYNPTKRAGARLGEKWKALFHATREALHRRSAEIGASHVLVRIRWREHMALEAMEAGNFPLANDILDRIAEEVGNMHAGANDVPRVATIIMTGRPEPASAPQAVARSPG
jgi:hypothetical protein